MLGLKNIQVHKSLIGFQKFHKLFSKLDNDAGIFPMIFIKPVNLFCFCVFDFIFIL